MRYDLGVYDTNIDWPIDIHSHHFISFHFHYKAHRLHHFSSTLSRNLDEVTVLVRELLDVFHLSL